MTIAQIIINKTIRNSYRYLYFGWLGTGYYLVNDLPVSDEEMNKMYPIDMPLKPYDKRKWKGDNPDRTRII